MRSTPYRPAPRSRRIPPAKDLYLSHETYIPFARNLYTSRAKPIYLSPDTYIPLERNLYTFCESLPEPIRTIRAYPINSDQSLLASILLNPLYNAMQYLVFLSILFVEEQNNSDL